MPVREIPKALPPSSSFFTTAPPYRRRWTVTRAPPLQHVRQQRSCSMLPLPDHPFRPRHPSQVSEPEPRCSAFAVDLDGIDPVRVKRQVFPDCRCGDMRSFVAPDRVDRPLSAGGNAVVGALALVGTIRLVRGPLQLRHIDVLARDVLQRGIGRFLQSQGLAGIGDAFAVHGDRDPAFRRRDGDRMIRPRNLDWLAVHDLSLQSLESWGSRRKIATRGSSLIQVFATDQPALAASCANESIVNLCEFSVCSRSPLLNAKVWPAALTIWSLRLTRCISMRLCTGFQSAR